MTTPDDKNILPKAVEWLNQGHFNTASVLSLTKACHFAEQLASQHESSIHESLIEQGLAIASELQTLKCDNDALSAALIYPSFIYTKAATELVTKNVDNPVAKLLLGTKKMEMIDTLSLQTKMFSQQQNVVDNLRKMLLAMVDDIRIVLIKLAERLVHLKYVQQQPEVIQKETAQKAMDIYAPLANRLGIGQFKWQMEDLAFCYLDTDNYNAILKHLNMQRDEREKYIDLIIKELEILIARAHFEKASIYGRAKHIHSIFRKMQRKHVDITKIYDTSAVRVLAPSIEDCYTALSLIHEKWSHVPKEFDDYIAKPKPNGYRSIHTAIIGPDNHHVEIQIRTYQMDDESERGVAAHWKYKEGKKPASSYEEKINWLREVIGWQKEVSPDTQSRDSLYQQIFEDRVYVFTPNGDVLDLALGATPLDFAYHVHTNLGHRCRGAKINGAIAPLTQALKTGDRVEILTTKEGHPSRDWLNPASGYLKTNHARAKVRHWFRQEILAENVPTGATRPKALPPEKTEKIETTVTQRDTGSFVTIENIRNLLTKLARCCQPIPGDPILGYITKGSGVTIHHRDCRNVQQALKFRSYRIIAVDWGAAPQQYPVNLLIEANDRSGLIRDISSILANEHIPILGLNTRVNKLENRAYITLTIEIKNLDVLDNIVNHLHQIPDVIMIKRGR